MVHQVCHSKNSVLKLKTEYIISVRFLVKVTCHFKNTTMELILYFIIFFISKYLEFHILQTEKHFAWTTVSELLSKMSCFAGNSVYYAALYTI